MSEILVNNRYKIIEKLGEGGMGSVYAVLDKLRNNKKIALKTIRKETVNTSAIDRFKKEFSIMTKLKHPNLAKVYDFGIDKEDMNPFITMELYKAESLSLTLKNNNITEQEYIKIFVSVLRAIEFIHTRGILHRDINPNNILITDKNEVKIIDFGLADLEKLSDYKTKGTLYYIAPEIFNGKSDKAADIYSLGVTLYKIVVKTEFYDTNNANILIKSLSDKNEFNHNKKIKLQKIENEGLKEIISKMLEFEPEKRYENASQIIFDLNEKYNSDFQIESENTKKAYVFGSDFVGRNKEINILKNKLRKGIGHQKLMLVKGSAGIGKSRLFAEFKKYCQIENINFYESDSNENIIKSYSSLISILEEMIYEAEHDLIIKYAPVLKKLLKNHPRFKNFEIKNFGDPQTEKTALNEAITDFLLDFPEQFRLQTVVYFNDIQWADENTLKIIENLMYKLSEVDSRKSNIRIYCSMREEEKGFISDFLENSEDKNRIEYLELKPFSKENVTQYFHSIFGENVVHSSIIDSVPEIEAKAKGNPFFLQEIIRILVENRIIDRKPEYWYLTESVQNAEIPASLTNLLAKEIEYLNLNERDYKLLSLLALINRPVTYGEFTFLTNENNNYITEFFELLQSKEIIDEEKFENRMYYKFSHALFADAVSVRMTTETKEEYHKFLAEKLQELHQDNLKEYYEETAYHYLNSNLQKTKEKTKLFLIYAAEKSAEQFAYSKALKYYDSLLKLTENPIKKLEILFKKGEICDNTGRWQESEAIYRETLKTAEKSKDDFLLNKAKNRLGGILCILRYFDEGLNLLDQAYEFFQNEDLKEEMYYSLKMKGNYFIANYESEKMSKNNEKQLKLAEELNDPEKISESLGRAALVFYYFRKNDKSMEYQKKRLKLAEENNLQREYARTMKAIGSLYYQERKYSKALEYYENLLETAEKIGDKNTISSVYNNMANTKSAMGDLNTALRYYLKSLKIAEEIGERYSISIGVYNIGLTYQLLGIYSKALEFYGRHLKMSEELGHRRAMCDNLLRTVEIHKRMKNYKKAEDIYDKVIKLSEEEKLPWSYTFIGKADLYCLLGRYEKAAELNKTARNIAETTQKQALILVDILDARLKYLKADNDGDRTEAVNALVSLLSETDDEEIKAEIYFTLFNLTGKDDYGFTSKEIYKKLYSKNPYAEYREQIEEIDNNIKDELFQGKAEDYLEKNYFNELLEIIHDLNCNLSLNSLLERIVDVSIDFVHADRGILFLYNEEGDLVPKISRNNDKKDLKTEEFAVSRTILSKVINDGEPLFAADIMDNEKIDISKSIINMELRSAMCIPLGRKFKEKKIFERRIGSRKKMNQLLGVLYIDSKRRMEENRFRTENLELVQALADQASVAILNAQLHEKINLDALTKLYLRPYFEEQLKDEIRYSHETNTQFSLMMIDIDFFKSINDRFGHLTGDTVLKELGKILKSALRESDTICRYGGEEFAVILPNTPLSQCKIVAEKVKTRIKEYKFPCGQVTVSIGIAVYPIHSVEGDTVYQSEQLIRFADQALYRSKENGRDCFTVWESSLIEEGKWKTGVSDILTGDPIRDYKNVQMLLKAFQFSGTSTDIESLLGKIIDIILDFTEMERGAVLLYNNSAETLEIKIARNSREETIKDMTISRSIPEQVFKSGEPVFIKKVTDDDATRSILNLELLSIMCIPLQVHESRLGIVYLDSKSVSRHFSKVELSFFNALTSLISGTLYNAYPENAADLNEREQTIKKLLPRKEKIHFDNLIEVNFPLIENNTANIYNSYIKYEDNHFLPVIDSDIQDFAALELLSFVKGMIFSLNNIFGKQEVFTKISEFIEKEYSEDFLFTLFEYDSSNRELEIISSHEIFIFSFNGEEKEYRVKPYEIFNLTGISSIKDIVLFISRKSNNIEIDAILRKAAEKIYKDSFNKGDFTELSLSYHITEFKILK